MICLNISVTELMELNSPNIIDIRPVQSYNNNHIPGAKNIPYNSLLINPSMYLKKDEKYYIYCKYGHTSKNLCNILHNQGYDVWNVVGGYEAWVLEN